MFVGLVPVLATLCVQGDLGISVVHVPAAFGIGSRLGVLRIAEPHSDRRPVLRALCAGSQGCEVLARRPVHACMDHRSLVEGEVQSAMMARPEAQLVGTEGDGGD